MMFICVVVIFCLQHFTLALNEGDKCELSDGEQGTCVLIQDCVYAQELIKKKIFPRICGFQECNEFYPDNDADHALVPGGKPSLVKEFPHMAVIGFGEKDDIQWQCGGSLISLNFVLTAAHCLNSRLGPAKFVRLGDLDISTDTDDAEPQDFMVKRAIPHPDYKNPSKYNDIGLIELDRNVTLTNYVGWACLDTEKEHNEKKMIATGWGKTEYVGYPSSFLLKTNLDVVDYNTCNKSYKSIPKYELPNGIQDAMHICAGGKPEQDTCEGDSGGPLQIRVFGRKGHFKNFNIVGVTSFGKACGISRAPGVYTRVSNYLSWIENTIWPFA